MERGREGRKELGRREGDRGREKEGCLCNKALEGYHHRSQSRE